MRIRPLSGRVFLPKTLLLYFHQVDNLGGPLLGGFAFNDVCVVSLFALNKLQELEKLAAIRWPLTRPADQKPFANLGKLPTPSDLPVSSVRRGIFDHADWRTGVAQLTVSARPANNFPFRERTAVSA